MKIAIVHDFLFKLGGAEKVLTYFHELYPEAPIYTLVYDKEGTKQVFEQADYKIIASNLNRLPARFRKNPRYLLPWLSSAIEQFDLSEYDVVISLSNSFAHGVITKPHTLHISYCFSPMRYAWDWYHDYLRENNLSKGPISAFLRYTLHNIRIWDQVAAHRVDQWIAQSQTVQDRIQKYYRQPSTIIYPPIDIRNIEMSDNAPDDYFLIVSRLEPYKKIDLAIEACNKLGRQLVIIGEGKDRNRLQALAGKTIEFLGRQSDKAVHEYMRNAYALIFPGEEDFGLTPLESMASGRPVLAYRKGGTVETVIDGTTGLFFNEPTSESLAECLNRFSDKYLSFSPSNCRKQAERFSVEQFKENIGDYVDSSYNVWIKRNG